MKKKIGNFTHHATSPFLLQSVPSRDPLSGESSSINMTERYDCHYCKESLYGKKYVLREENPYCVKCYESLYSNTCEDCKKPIGCNSRVSEVTRQVANQSSENPSPARPSAAPAGSVLQGPPLARGLLHMLPVQTLTGGQALLHQG